VVLVEAEEEDFTLEALVVGQAEAQDSGVLT
jgi:hypothetical protein